MSDFVVNWTDAAGVAKQTSINQSDNTPNPSLPVVLLLHGGGGNISHMSNPTVSPGVQFDVAFVPDAVIDRGWHGYPNVGLWSISTSPPNNTPGLQGALSAFGYTALNYAQVGPNDHIDFPAVELDAVLRAVLNRFPNKKLALVCHSRGGLLARYFLQRNRGDLNVLSRLAGIVTLHTPNQGSEVADVAVNIHNRILALLEDPNIRDNATLRLYLRALDTLVNNAWIPELRPSSAFLTKLRSDEATQLPVNIPIHTFGGTNPRLLSIFLSLFDAMSAVPQWHWPPFHWRTNQVNFLNLLDGTDVANICPEERAGGDVLVTDVRSHVPNESGHNANPVNHANALNHAGIQSQVRDVLATMRSNASFVSQNVPGNVLKGSTYPVSITMKNTGLNTWVSGVNCPFRLGSQNPQDNSVWGISRKDVPPERVAPGATVTFTFDVTAPATPGTYHFQWRMLQENVEWFGAATPDVLVNVQQAAAVSGITITPSNLGAGSFMTVQVNVASPAPASGTTVTLTSSKPNTVGVPAYVVVPAGQTSGSISARAASVPVPTSVTLTATLGSTVSASVMVSPSAAYPYGTAMAAGVGASLI